MSDKSKLVYICSPYRTGDVDENVKRAREYCRLAVEEGFVPVAPHLLYPQFLDDLDFIQHKEGMKCCIELLSVCASVFVFDYTDESDGMRKEIAYAVENGIPIYHASLLPSGGGLYTSEIDNYHAVLGALREVSRFEKIEKSLPGHKK